MVLEDMKYIFLSSSVKGIAMAAPAGETCLKEVAAAMPVFFFSSFTSCQPLRASRKLIYPGLPLIMVTGSFPLADMEAHFWFGLRPYFS